MTQFTIPILDFHIVALYSKSNPIKFTLYQQKILVRYAHLTMRNGCQPVFRKKKKLIIIINGFDPVVLKFLLHSPRLAIRKFPVAKSNQYFDNITGQRVFILTNVWQYRNWMICEVCDDRKPVGRENINKEPAINNIQTMLMF